MAWASAWLHVKVVIGAVPPFSDAFTRAPTRARTREGSHQPPVYNTGVEMGLLGRSRRCVITSSEACHGYLGRLCAEDSSIQSPQGRSRGRQEHTGRSCFR